MARETQVVAEEKSQRIQIRNVYYMFLYAWECFTAADETDLELSESTNLVDLFAKFLLSGTRGLIRRGLDRGYEEVVEEARSPRGRFLLGDSLERASWLRGALICSFDELNPDLLHNQIIKATIKHLLNNKELDRTLAHELRILLSHMAEVTDVRLSDAAFSRVRLTRNTRHYGLLLKVCHLLLTHQLVGEGSGQGSFRSFLTDETAMHALFERFVRNFYKREQSLYTVAASQVPWDVKDSVPEEVSFLPVMQTDIVLQSGERTLIIDTKYYNQVLTGRGRPKVQSAHLYQILTYLSQWSQSNLPKSRPDGLLLYAKTAGEAVRLSYSISGFRLRVQTIDLNQPWSSIHSDLLNIVGPETTV